MKKLLIALIVIGFGHLPIFAHNFWASKLNNNVKLYFGDWEESIKEEGEKLNHINTEVILPHNSVKTITRHNDHVNLELHTSGDIVIVNTREPRKSRIDESVSQNIIATRAGREEVITLATLDVLPDKPNSNTFTLMFNGQPLAQTNVTLYSPTTWSKPFKSNENGKFTIHTPWQGEYMLVLKHNDNMAGQINKKAYYNTNYTTTITFMVKNGIPWGRPLEEK
ncbi:MAG: hypothetical protein WC149_04030 [Arcobacteraceae bacterium]